MGIRVNRFMGYGLTDVEPGEDPRVSWRSPLLTGKSRRDIAVEKYQEFLERREAKENEQHPERRNYRSERAFIRWALAKGETFDLTSAVTYDNGESEDGQKVLVVRPLTDRDWHRFDDTVDWMEESYLRYPDRDGNTYERVDMFPGTIYPYQFYVDRRTGARLGGMIHEWVRMSRYTERFARERPWGDMPLLALDEVAKDIGFESHDDAWANVIPGVPEAIHDLVEFGQLFTDSRTVLELRPMLYTFWR